MRSSRRARSRTGRATLASVALLASAALAGLACTGCVASIRELRLPGPDRPAADATGDVAHETRDGAAALSATPSTTPPADGVRLDVGVARVLECRDVATVRSMVRDVQVLRSFGDDAQERNVALSFLLAAAVGLVAYAANQPVCVPTHPGCSVGTATAFEYGLGGAALVPLGFATYNALRAQSGVSVESAPPRLDATPWVPCGMRPLAGEVVQIVVGERAQTAETGADGHVVVDVSALWAGLEGAARRAIVRHEGLPDAEVSFPAASPAR